MHIKRFLMVCIADIRLEIALGIVCFCCLLACGGGKSLSKPSSDAQLRILNTSLSMAVRRSGDINVPVERTNTFAPTDKHVVSLVYFTQLAGAHQMRWEWYGPDDRLYHSTGNHEFKARAGTMVERGTATHKLLLKGTKAIQSPGDWKVKIYLDDALVAVNDFKVSNPGGALSPVEPAAIASGSYYALIIGNSSYAALPNINSAYKDVSALANVLTKKYNFKVNLQFDRSRDEIKALLAGLAENLKPEDNLLIYYSGHGWMEQGAKECHWLPVDATINDIHSWISCEEITADIAKVPANHVMVIADSCYSGKAPRDVATDLEKPRSSNYFRFAAQKKSRSVLCSGGLKPVMDASENNGRSIFANAIIKALNDNKKILDGTRLFSLLQRPMIFHAGQTPDYSNILDEGEGGGDFLFYCDH